MTKPAGKVRLDVTPSTLRLLMFASGGYCAMEPCENPALIQPSQGYIGTVSHIVAAEDGGPRSDPSMSPYDKRAFDNLMLLCANHGREIDDSTFGETKFPIARLRQIKQAHERLVGDALAQALDKVNQGSAIPPTQFLDTSPRSAKAHSTAGGLVAFLGLEEEQSKKNREILCRELDSSKLLLENLSQPALSLLAELVTVWDRARVLGPSPPRPRVGSGVASVSRAAFTNRQHTGSDKLAKSALDELVEAKFLDIDESELRLMTPWAPTGAESTGWETMAEYLSGPGGLSIGEWIRRLDYRIFDDLEPAGT